MIHIYFVLKLILGELPNDFLRVGPRSQSDSDQQLAIALDRQLNSSTACSVVGCLNITIEQVSKFYYFLLKIRCYFIFVLLWISKFINL